MHAVFRRTGAAPWLCGVVHLLPLPGSPTPSPGLSAVIDAALADAEALTHGAQAAIVENFGDAPFSRGAVEPSVVAAMTRVVAEIRRAFPSLTIGVNVLRNDAQAALAVAAATGASFIRVNVHTGAMVTDQGLIQSDARATLLERRRLGVEVAIAADVLVKHAVPLGAPDLADVARDTVRRGGASAVIVTGSGTGRPLDPRDLDVVRAAVPEAVLLAGSGTDLAAAAALRGRLDGAIVGTWLHAGSDLGRRLDPARVRQLADALAG
jgi:membrane complex biogenesis BtpA family protein